MKQSMVILVTILIVFSGCIGSQPLVDDEMEPIDEPREKYIIITIDTEAQYPRANQNPVQELIYGNFTQGRVGIIEMMDAANNVGIKLTFFVDVLEEYLYPGEIRQVLHDIAENGHDIQLHQHPYLIPNETWKAWENESEGATLSAENTTLNCWDRQAADFIVEKMISIFSEEGIETPIASRGGSYRFNAEILNSFQAHGINYSYNYNPAAANVNVSLGKQPLFQWSNGVYEVPISFMPSANQTIDPYKRFDESYWNSTNLAIEIDDFFNESNGDNVLVMMLHSWSLLGTVPDDSDGKYNYIYDGEWRKEAFVNFLGNIPEDVNIITATELAKKIESGELQPSTQFDEHQIQNEC
jgi:hypothetical protein